MTLIVQNGIIYCMSDPENEYSALFKAREKRGSEGANFGNDDSAAPYDIFKIARGMTDILVRRTLLVLDEQIEPLSPLATSRAMDEMANRFYEDDVSIMAEAFGAGFYKRLIEDKNSRVVFWSILSPRHIPRYVLPPFPAHLFQRGDTEISSDTTQQTAEDRTHKLNVVDDVFGDVASILTNWRNAMSKYEFDQAIGRIPMSGSALKDFLDSTTTDYARSDVLVNLQDIREIEDKVKVVRLLALNDAKDLVTAADPTSIIQLTANQGFGIRFIEAQVSEYANLTEPATRLLLYSDKTSLGDEFWIGFFSDGTYELGVDFVYRDNQSRAEYRFNTGSEHFNHMRAEEAVVAKMLLDASLWQFYGQERFALI